MITYAIIAVAVVALILIFSNERSREKSKPFCIAFAALLASVIFLWKVGLISKVMYENTVKEAGGLENIKKNIVYLMNMRYVGYTEENKEATQEKLKAILTESAANEVINDLEKVHTNTFFDLEEEFLLRMNPKDIPGDEGIQILSDAGTEGAEDEEIGTLGISGERYDYDMVDWRVQSVNGRRGVWLKNLDISPATGEDSILINGEVYPMRLSPQYALPSLVKNPQYNFELVDIFITEDGNFVANLKSKDFAQTARETYSEVIKELEEKTSSLSDEDKERFISSLVNTGKLPDDAPRTKLSTKGLYNDPNKNLASVEEFSYTITDDGLEQVGSDMLPDPKDNKEGEFFTKEPLNFEEDDFSMYYVTLTGQITRDGKIQPKELEKIVGVFVETH